MDILKRSLAPITDQAWAEIDAQASRILRGNLSARSLVDFSGPGGLEMGAVNLGCVEIKDSEPVKGVHWGIRQVLPLMEVRVPFSLKLMDLDNLSRGGRTPALEALDAAAHKAAIFEESVVYKGFEEACVVGMLAESPHAPVALTRNPEEFVSEVEQAVVRIQQSGIGGPFALVFGTNIYQLIMSGDQGGYPLSKRLRDMAGAGIHWSPALSGGAAISTRGGDYELSVGQDLAVGYLKHDEHAVQLFITESFTFRVLEPAAAVEFTMTK
jgi:uncharacterized linocin/CFP29 family protein